MTGKFSIWVQGAKYSEPMQSNRDQGVRMFPVSVQSTEWYKEKEIDTHEK